MYRIILTLSFCLFFNCSGNAQGETVYLLFEDNKPVKCHISAYRDGRDKKEVIKTAKKNIFYKKNIIFEICHQFFVFNPDINTKKTIDTKPRNIVHIDYLINKLEEDYLNSKEKLFKKIYVLEKKSDNEYIEYEVLWKDMYINDN